MEHALTAKVTPITLQRPENQLEPFRNLSRIEQVIHCPLFLPRILAACLLIREEMSDILSLSQTTTSMLPDRENVLVIKSNFSSLLSTDRDQR